VAEAVVQQRTTLLATLVAHARPGQAERPHGPVATARTRLAAAVRRVERRRDEMAEVGLGRQRQVLAELAWVQDELSARDTRLVADNAT